MGLTEAIAKAQAALEKLQSGTYEIITRSTPATWENLRSDLEEKLVPILKELFDQIGGLMEQPTVILPDGVTSTSLVSQSEMTQFVTNTLNTWLGNLNERIKEAKKDTIFSFQPAIALLKHVPRIIPLNVTTSLNDVIQPTISFSKTSFKSKYFEFQNEDVSSPSIEIRKEI